MPMAVFMRVAMRVSMFSRAAFFLPKFLPRQLLLPGGDHIQLDSADPATLYARNLEASIHAHSGHGFFQQLHRHSGID